EARLTMVGLFDSRGHLTNSVRSGDEVTVRLEYETFQRIDKPVFGLALENREGVYVWSSNTRDAEHVPDCIEGTGRIELRVPRLPLQPGAFDLSASIVDITTVHTYDYLRH